MQNEFYLLLIGQTFTVLLLFLTHFLNKRATERALNIEIKTEKRIAHIENQLANFYGPIHILLSINYSIFKLRFDNDADQYTNIVPEAIWHELRDQIITPNNDEITMIIKNNIHLINNPIIHQSIIDFVLHAEIRKRELDKKMSQEEYLARFKFPSDFFDLVENAIAELQQEHVGLVGKHKT